MKKLLIIALIVFQSCTPDEPGTLTKVEQISFTQTELYNEVKNEFLEQSLEWETSTDRDIDFKRTHPKQYYQYAIQWVMNEVYLKTKNRKILMPTEHSLVIGDTIAVHIRRATCVLLDQDMISPWLAQ